MNINKKLAIAVMLVGTILSACQKDILETVPDDRVSSAIYWKTLSDAEYAVNSVYSSLDDVNVFIYDGISDIGHTNTTFTAEYNIESGNYDASHARILSEWRRWYRGVFLANDVLDNIDRITTDQTATKERLRAETRVLRAYFYHRLVGLFGDVPLIERTILPSEGQELTRNTASAVYDFIDKELTAAAENLPASYTGGNKGRVTKGAALALKARADLYAGRYAESAEAAKKVMDLGVYSLYPKYGELFKYAAENNSEVILDHQFLTGTNQWSPFAFMGPYSQRSSGSNFVPTKDLADLFTMQNGKGITDPTSGYDPSSPYKNRDPRMGFTMWLNGDKLPTGITYSPVPGSGGDDEIGRTQQNTTTGYNLKKYVVAEDLTTPSASGLNLMLIRYAEVLLTYAEAKIELNQIDNSVYDAINAVRTRSDVGLPALASGMTQAELREAVRRERTVELAFEGFRLFDIRRWKTAADVMQGMVYGIDYEKNGKVETVVVPSALRSFDASKHYLWPLPQTEILMNPKLEQNPGW